MFEHRFYFIVVDHVLRIHNTSGRFHRPHPERSRRAWTPEVLRDGACALSGRLAPGRPRSPFLFGIRHFSFQLVISDTAVSVLGQWRSLFGFRSCGISVTSEYEVTNFSSRKRPKQSLIRCGGGLNDCCVIRWAFCLCLLKLAIPAVADNYWLAFITSDEYS